MQLRPRLGGGRDPAAAPGDGVGGAGDELGIARGEAIAADADVVLEARAHRIGL